MVPTHAKLKQNHDLCKAILGSLMYTDKSKASIIDDSNLSINSKATYSNKSYFTVPRDCNLSHNQNLLGQKNHFNDFFTRRKNDGSLNSHLKQQTHELN